MGKKYILVKDNKVVNEKISDDLDLAKSYFTTWLKELGFNGTYDILEGEDIQSAEKVASLNI